LNLRLLVHAEDQGAIGRIQVKAHDVPDLLDQQRVSREFETLASMRRRPKARQIRATLLRLKPVLLANERVLQ